MDEKNKRLKRLKSEHSKESIHLKRIDEIRENLKKPIFSPGVNFSVDMKDDDIKFLLSQIDRLTKEGHTCHAKDCSCGEYIDQEFEKRRMK